MGVREIVARATDGDVEFTGHVAPFGVACDDGLTKRESRSPVNLWVEDRKGSWRLIHGLSKKREEGG